MTTSNVTFSTTSVHEYANGRNSLAMMTVLIVATFTTRNGRAVSATGWTQKTALSNLARKCGGAI